MKKEKYIIGIIMILIIAIFACWYFFMRSPHLTTDNSNPPQGTGFHPFGNPPTAGNGTKPANNTGSSTLSNNPVAKIPTLRLLSNTPVGGYAASTTASTTIIRWIDRGRGNIYQAAGNNLDIVTISNTLLPRMYQSLWNKNATAFIGSVIEDGSSVASTLYAELRPQPAAQTATSGPSASGTSTAAPFVLKGKNLPQNVLAYALSPKKDRLFMLVGESGKGIGYVSALDGSSMTQIFDTPLTQVNADWPEDNTIAITTKGTANEMGYLYFVNPKSGVWKKIAGPLLGLSAKVSHDAKHVIVSSATTDQNLSTDIYSIGSGASVDAVIRTLADKCAWGNFYKEMVYCAVPSQPATATYPDDWYKGLISFTDKIWQVNASTGEVHLISSIVDQSDRVIDAFNLGLDEKDNYLVFMNKNDLSLWSLDLVSSN